MTDQPRQGGPERYQANRQTIRAQEQASRETIRECVSPDHLTAQGARMSIQNAALGDFATRQASSQTVHAAGGADGLQASGQTVHAAGGASAGPTTTPAAQQAPAAPQAATPTVTPTPPAGNNK
jgi:hypothetical protein